MEILKRGMSLLSGALLACSLAGTVSAAQRTAAEQALLEAAIKSCNGPQYPSGAQPIVNYGRGTFTCLEPGSTRR